MKTLSMTTGVWLGWLGVVAGTMSCISLITRMMRIGLQPVFEEAVAFYRKLLSPLYDLFAALPLQVPASVVDGLIVYGVLLGLSFRAEFSASRNIVWRYANLDKEFGPIDDAIRVLKTFLLQPVLTMQPVFDLRELKRRKWSEHDTFEFIDEDEFRQIGPRGLDKKNKLMRQQIRASAIQTLAMFGTLPVGIIVFFALNTAS